VGLLHVLLLNTHDGPDLILLGGDHGAAHGARPSVRADPGRRRAGLPAGRGDADIAAEADDVVEVQFLGQQPVELLVAEAAIGQDADLDVGRQYLGEPHQHAVFIQVPPVLQGLLVHGQPYQRGRAAMIGDQ